MSDKANEAWQKIPPADRHDCGIFAQDYGQAGAIDFLGPKYGLPQSLSGHQSWWLWGPRGYSGNCLIVLDALSIEAGRSPFWRGIGLWWHRQFFSLCPIFLPRDQ